MPTTKFWLALAAGIAYGGLVQVYFTTTLETFGHELHALCHPDAATALFGWAPLDSIICYYVQVFKYALQDPLGSDVTYVLLGFFGTILAFWLMEGARRDANRALTFAPLFSLLANAVGISVIFPAVWMPVYYYSNNSGKDTYIRPAKANGVLFAMLAGYVIPTVYMCIGLEPKTRTEELVIALWQFAPLLFTPLFTLATSSLKCLEDPDDPRMTEDARLRIRVGDSRSAVERAYVFLGVLNVIVYYATYVRAKVQDLLSIEAFVELAMAASSERSIGNTGEFFRQTMASHIMLVDLAAFFIYCVFFALLEDGIKGAILLLLGSAAVGPGAAFAFYAVYREGRIQDLKRIEKKKN